MVWDYISNSLEDTVALGTCIGRYAYHGLYVALLGELGAGKTHLVKGIAKGMGIQSEVISPTFAFIHEYEGKTLSLYHFDVYRLESVDELEDIGFYEYGKHGVTIVEWANKFPDALPHHVTTISLSYLSENSRLVKIEVQHPRAEKWLKEVTYDLVGN